MAKDTKKHLIQNFGSGVKSDVSGIYIGDSFVPDALNVDFSLIKGAARKRMGYVRTNDGTGLGEAGDTDKAVTGIYQDKLGGVWQNLICAGSGVYAWDIANDSAAPIDTGQTEGKNYLYDFTTFRTDTDGDCIFLAHDHQDPIKKWDGTSFSNVDFDATGDNPDLDIDWTIAAYYAKCIETFNNYLFTANTKEDGTVACERVRWSNIGDAEDNDSSDNFIDVYTTAGKEIRAIKKLRDLLIVYKEDSIWAIYYTGDSTAPFGLYCIDHNTPCIAGHSVADVKGEHYFLSEQGIMKTNGAKVDPVLVSKDVPEWFKYVSRDDWQYAYGSTNEYMKQYRLLLPYHGATDVTDKDREVRYDYEDNTWSAHEYAGNANVIGTMILTTTGTWDTIYRYFDEIEVDWEHPSLWSRHTRYFSGDYSGFLRIHDTVERDDEGTDQAIESYFFTKPLHLAEDLKDIDKYKRLYKVLGRLKSFENSSLSVWKRTDRNGDPELVGSIDCDQTNVDFIGKLDLSGSCREIEYKIGNNASLQPWAVYWLQTEFKIMSEK